jgi:hypothetical protein
VFGFDGGRIMPAEHLRENGKLSQGYYCGICGQVVAMYGHTKNQKCEPNPKLVAKLDAMNRAGSAEQYAFDRLKRED